MFLSVVIPTFNRKTLLLESLAALSQQTLPSDWFEVIVVDDGSDEDISEITKIAFPFNLQYIRQENQGDAAARNLGAKESSADLLVFIDDDMLIEQGYLSAFVEAHEHLKNALLMGTTHIRHDGYNSEFQNIYGIHNNKSTKTKASFVDLCSNNMSIRRSDYFIIGGMDNLGFKGSSLWCDVDFAYRAYKLGFDFYRTPNAIGYEKDYVTENLDNARKRGYQMAYRAVVLFQKHPDLIDHIPMFHDKTPIDFGSDNPGLILRKIARLPASSRTLLYIMEQVVRFLEKFTPSPQLLRPIYRWVIGGYIYCGYRDGLRGFKQENFEKIGGMHQNTFL